MRGNLPEKSYFSAFTINMVFVLLMIGGIAVIPRLSLQEMPSRLTPRMTISYNWPHAPAVVIEQRVTSVLEGVLATVPEVRNISSVTSAGRGSITVQFDSGTDIHFKKYEVTSLIRSTARNFPEQVSQPRVTLSGVGGTETRAKTILVYELNADASRTYIAEFAEENIRLRLGMIEGVENISVVGGSGMEWEISYDDNILNSIGITPGHITSALNSFFTEREIGGVIESGAGGIPRRIFMSYKGNISDEVLFGDIPVASERGRIVRLGDLATLRYTEMTPMSFYRINGLNTVTMTILAESGSNHIKVASDVKNEIETIRGDLPEGYTIRLRNDLTETVVRDINRIIYRTLFSAILLLLFVMVISRQVRYLFVITISLAANLTIAMLFYYLLNIQLHLQSLVGITVSFGIIIDNTIVMTDHLRYHRNRRVFLAILAATLTTIGALSVIFFLSENLKLQLADFAAVIIVNLSISLCVALLLIPALLTKINLAPRRGRRAVKRLRRAVRAASLYRNYITFGRRHRWAFITLMILGFGLPVFMLPSRLPQGMMAPGRELSWYERLYNITLGSQNFNRDIRPKIEKVIGGTLRLFQDQITRGAFFFGPQQQQGEERQRTRLNVSIERSQQGLTIENLNDIAISLENMLTRYDEIETFTTRITSATNATLTIEFLPEHDFTIFPYLLKMQIQSFMNSVGSYSTSIHGVGEGFSNRVSMYSEQIPWSTPITLEGYNYDDLVKHAEDLRDRLLTNQRIREVYLTTGGSRARVYHNRLIPDDEHLARSHMSTLALRSRLETFDIQPRYAGLLTINGIEARAVTRSMQSDRYDLWYIRNTPVATPREGITKIGENAVIERELQRVSIERRNQNYVANIIYEFIGSGMQAREVRDRNIEETEAMLPLGYRISEQSRRFGRQIEDTDYLLLFLIMLIIFIICSILLESLLQPLIVIILIPVSFIGVFLTVHILKIPSGQGIFAAMILLCGLVVNSSLYIINDFNNLRRKGVSRAGGQLTLYLKAFNMKIVPIVLTIVSTVVGLTPFLLAGSGERFWFPLAACTVGGLIFSMVGLIIIMPLFIRLTGKESHTDISDIPVRENNNSSQ